MRWLHRRESGRVECQGGTQVGEKGPLVRQREAGWLSYKLAVAVALRLLTRA